MREEQFTWSRFERACQTLAIKADRKVFDDLASAYGEPTRAYHNRTHVSACLAALDHYGHTASAPAEIEMALWFHDAVYDATRGDNEALSAAWALEALGAAGLTNDALARVEAMIVATKTHDASALGTDGELMLDIDLGILGMPPEVFERYDAQIGEEYSWVPEDAYGPRRCAVLQQFLARERIYLTDEVRGDLEAQARSNLKRKIEELSE